jgi:hypothetical protein
MHQWHLGAEDFRQAQTLGINATQLEDQLRTFAKSDFYLFLDRPCTIGDGILQVSEEQAKLFAARQEEAARRGRFLKFVPASGAATRMFQVPLAFLDTPPLPPLEALRHSAEGGDSHSRELLAFFTGLRRFAFHDALRAILQANGKDLEELIDQGALEPILIHLLTERGLDYRSLPKGLLPFHRYPEENRTAFEEHLVESIHYVRDAEGACRLHFTVSPEHRQGFLDLMAAVCPRYERRHGVRFLLDYSVQKRSTDTLAVDPDNRPFRHKDGSLLFRPSGHGALLENLNDLQGDLVYLKNIDNVVHDRLKPTTTAWKKILGGLLCTVQDHIHDLLTRLQQGELPDPQETSDLLHHRLHLTLPPNFGQWASERRKQWLLDRLNRPLRVCGVVRNVGEPGGGPFWVRARDGALSLQIVESAQVDPRSAEQMAVWNAATHFNPVDVVCAVRDYTGRPFDLRHFVDRDAVFISRKSKDGRDLKALERPGLWNGSMADWITLFVEVPRITFNPVKTVTALLAPEHQPQPD